MCLFSYPDLVNLLLNNQVDVNMITASGDSALHGAVFGNKLQIMQSLINAGQQEHLFHDKYIYITYITSASL